MKRLLSTFWWDLVLCSYLRVSKRIEVLAKWVELTVGGLAETCHVVWGFADVSIFLFVSQHVYIEWGGTESHPDCHLTQEFLNFSTTDILGQIILYLGGCPVYCRIFSRISGIYPLANCRQVVTIKNVSTHCQISVDLSYSLGNPQFALSRQ